MASDGTILVRVLTEENGAGVSSGPEVIRGDEVEQEALWSRRGSRLSKDVEVKVDQLGASLRDISAKLERALAISDDAPSASGFHVEEFKVGLAVSGSGKIVLVGELGVEASIEVTFKRRSAAT